MQITLPLFLPAALTFFKEKLVLYQALKSMCTRLQNDERNGSVSLHIVTYMKLCKTISHLTVQAALYACGCLSFGRIYGTHPCMEWNLLYAWQYVRRSEISAVPYSIAMKLSCINLVLLKRHTVRCNWNNLFSWGI